MTQPPICDYEGSPYQKIFWDQANRQYEDLAEANALRLLLPRGGKRLLELGAGAGRNTLRYSGFYQIVLVDYSRSQLECARERLGNSALYIFVAADIYRLPFAPGLFDAATMIRTMHHMADPLAALQEIRRVLEPDAFFLLEYANKRNLKSILRFLLKRQSWNPFSSEAIEFANLNFNFHPKVIQQWLVQSGFIIHRQITVSHFRAVLLKRLLPASLLAWVDSLFGKTGDLFQLSPSVFVSASADGTGEKNTSGFFQCLVCHATNLMEQISPQGSLLLCPGCGARWGIRGGIYDFREPLMN